MNILDLKKEDFPSWYFEKTHRPEDLDNFQFYYYKDCIYEEISVENIVGTSNKDYCHKAWLEMLSNLKRHKTDNDIESIREIILKENDDKSVKEYNGKYYIAAGNHRFCQAKFLGIVKVHCNVSKYEFNNQDFSLYMTLINNDFTCTYSDGIFRDIKLGDICIHVRAKDDISQLISAYKTMQIRIFDKIRFRKKTPITNFLFNGDKESYRALKYAIMALKRG